MERIGYDADTQTYSYRDRTTGKFYEGDEGNRYGKLHPGTFSRRCHFCIPNVHRCTNTDTIPLVGETRTLPTPSAQEAQELQMQSSNHEALRHMLPFALLVLSFMLLMFYWVGFR